jgi:hypothetical protein
MAATGIVLRRKDCGSHSLLRTKVSIIYEPMGNLPAAQIPLGHTNIESASPLVPTSRTHSPSQKTLEGETNTNASITRFEESYSREWSVSIRSSPPNA